ncbi:MAG: hypothetical protein ACI4WS_11605 [Oscillospiraceae bacterium]
MNNQDKTARTPVKAISGREEGYRLAKLLRAGNRELARQLNIKKSQKPR